MNDYSTAIEDMIKFCFVEKRIGYTKLYIYEVTKLMVKG